MTTSPTPPAPEPTKAEQAFVEKWWQSEMDMPYETFSKILAADLRAYVAAQLRAANQPKDDDAQAINFYLGCIAQHGEPAMDMGNWSDFVNRVQRVARASAQLAAKEAEIGRLRPAADWIVNLMAPMKGHPWSDHIGITLEKVDVHELLAIEAALQPQQQETSK